MKCSKILSFFLTFFLLSGCAGMDSVELSTNAEDNVVFSTAIEESGELPLITSISSQEKLISEETDYSTKEFEKKSISELSNAEQIYSSLYNLAEFEHYIAFGIPNDINTDKSINVERIHFPTAGLPREKIGTIYYETFYLIENGRLSNGVDFSMWLDTFASYYYIVSGFKEWYKETFVVSEGKIYVSEYLVGNYGKYGVTDNLALEGITVLNDKKIQLDFSFLYYGIYIGSKPESIESLTVVMEYEEGWKIYSYSEGYGTTALINELVRNEKPSCLQEQIESYLLQNSIS